MEPIFELAITLPERGSGDLLRSLHRQLRDAIVDGRLQSGLRLPPTRVLAEKLVVSRNTVMAAYDLLLSEGYLEGRRGAGTFVADVRPKLTRPKAHLGRQEPDRRLAPFWRTYSVGGVNNPVARYRYDLRTGMPDFSQFPFDIWNRLYTRACRAVARELSAPIELQGRSGLREAIAKHVSFARAVAERLPSAATFAKTCMPVTRSSIELASHLRPSRSRSVGWQRPAVDECEPANEERDQESCHDGQDPPGPEPD